MRTVQLTVNIDDINDEEKVIRIVLVKQTSLSCCNNDVTISVKGAEVVSDTTAALRVNLPHNFDVSRFPFDTHAVTLTVYAHSVSDEAQQLENAHLSLHMGNTPGRWHTIVTRPDIDSDPSIVTMLFQLSRRPGYLCTRIGMPLGVIWSLTLSTMVGSQTDAHRDARSGICIAALLATIGYRWNIDNLTPRCDRMLIVDWYIYITNLFVLFSLLATWKPDSPWLRVAVPSAAVCALTCATVVHFAMNPAPSVA